MLSIVVTGGIGSGKSTAAEFFRARGAHTIDLDGVAAGLLSPGSQLLGRVAAEFGEDDVLLADGRLDRQALALRAFATQEAAARLNAIVHPAVERAAAEELERLRRSPDAPAVVALEVPLLAEAPGIAQLADVVLAIVAPESVRVQRATERGMTAPEALRRLKRQATDAERAALADSVIVNDRSVSEFRAALGEFWVTHVGSSGAGL